jgi:hypothetical protein
MDASHSIEIKDRARVPPILIAHCTCGWTGPARISETLHPSLVKTGTNMTGLTLDARNASIAGGMALVLSRARDQLWHSGHLLRYFMPVSHMTVTTVVPAPSCSAKRRAAMTLQPVEVPAKMPSSRASRSAICRASSVETCSI